MTASGTPGWGGGVTSGTGWGGGVTSRTGWGGVVSHGRWPGRAKRASRGSLALAAIAAAFLAAVFLATGCSTHERICGSGEYPVKAVGNRTGRTCAPDGKEPPAGYVRYPAGKVPQYVDDEWDRYWRSIVVDSNGNIVTS